MSCASKPVWCKVLNTSVVKKSVQKAEVCGIGREKNRHSPKPWEGQGEQKVSPLAESSLSRAW